MANLTPQAPTNAGAVSVWTASAPAGDAIVYNGGDLLLEFDNGHASSITITFAPTQTTARVPGVGSVPVPSRSIALAAGAQAVFLFKSNEIAAYLDVNGRLPITYTSGNAALLLRAQRVD